jgi:hypothetical protein
MCNARLMNKNARIFLAGHGELANTYRWFLAHKRDARGLTGASPTASL